MRRLSFTAFHRPRRRAPAAASAVGVDVRAPRKLVAPAPPRAGVGPPVRLSGLLMPRADAGVRPALLPGGPRRGLLPGVGLQPPAPAPDLLRGLQEARTRTQLDAVEARPGTAELRGAWPELAGAMCGATLGLCNMAGEMLAPMGEARLEDLLAQIARSEHRVRWYDGPSHAHRLHGLLRRRKRASVHGVAALTLHLLATGHREVADRVILRRPVDIANELGERVPGLFGMELAVEIFRVLVPQITGGAFDRDHPEDLEANALGTIVQALLAEHAEEDPGLIEAWIISLMQRLEESGFEPSTPNLGLLAGTIIAGGLRYCRSIHALDERRFRAINNVSLLGFAAANLLPLPGPAIGAFAVVAVAAGLVLERLYEVRDFSEFIHRLEGKLSARLLKLKIFRNPYELPLLMNWIHTAILCNGLP
jgi:hypothetical protein